MTYRRLDTEPVCRDCRQPLTAATQSSVARLCTGCLDKTEKRAAERHADNPLFLVGTEALAKMLGGDR